jgi:hypothetical protein
MQYSTVPRSNYGITGVTYVHGLNPMFRNYSIWGCARFAPEFAYAISYLVLEELREPFSVPNLAYVIDHRMESILRQDASWRSMQVRIGSEDSFWCLFHEFCREEADYYRPKAPGLGDSCTLLFHASDYDTNEIEGMTMQQFLENILRNAKQNDELRWRLR